VYTLALPGERCGPAGRFGRPQYRIAADGRSSLDLRFVDAGCHVVKTDLETGEWSSVDGVAAPAVCSASRQIPAAHFATALRGYVREIEAAAARAGADPTAAYALWIGDDGRTQLRTKRLGGEALTVDVANFPVTTPLRRIEVSILGSVPRLEGTHSVQGLEPL